MKIANENKNWCVLCCDVFFFFENRFAAHMDYCSHSYFGISKSLAIPFRKMTVFVKNIARKVNKY